METGRDLIPVTDPGDRLAVPCTLSLTDRWRRTIRYLRVSVTDRCNYGCTYCMPPEGFPHAEREKVLTLEEVTRVVGVFAGLGVERVRLTGGEPLVRRHVDTLVRQIAALPGVREVAMTTNGHLLDRFAAPLWDAGLRTLNVSIDTFDPARFAEMTRGGDLVRVIGGLLAAGEAGFQDIRINAVVVGGQNDHEVADLVRRCWDFGWIPRFIELMPMGGVADAAAGGWVSMERVRGRLTDAFPLSPRSAPTEDGAPPRGPAVYDVVVSGPYAGRRVGYIRPMSDDGFCATCNRARLTAQGAVRACLADDREVSLLHAVRSGADDDVLRALVLEAVFGKREAHRMRTWGGAPQTAMTALGG